MFLRKLFIAQKKINKIQLTQFEILIQLYRSPREWMRGGINQYLVLRDSSAIILQELHGL